MKKPLMTACVLSTMLSCGASAQQLIAPTLSASGGVHPGGSVTCAGQLVVGNATAGAILLRQGAVPAWSVTPCNPCDTNCDGSVNGFDISEFIAALNGSPGDCSPCSSDTNADGSINGFDIAGFVDCLTP